MGGRLDFARSDVRSFRFLVFVVYMFANFVQTLCEFGIVLALNNEIGKPPIFPHASRDPRKAAVVYRQHLMRVPTVSFHQPLGIACP